MQVPEVSDGRLVEVWVRGVGGKPSNKKEKQVKLAFVKTNKHIQRPLYLDSLEHEYRQHQYHHQRPLPPPPNTCVVHLVPLFLVIWRITSLRPRCASSFQI